MWKYICNQGQLFVGMVDLIFPIISTENDFICTSSTQLKPKYVKVSTVFERRQAFATATISMRGFVPFQSTQTHPPPTQLTINLQINMINMQTKVIQHQICFQCYRRNYWKLKFRNILAFIHTQYLCNWTILYSVSSVKASMYGRWVYCTQKEVDVSSLSLQ